MLPGRRLANYSTGVMLFQGHRRGGETERLAPPDAVLTAGEEFANLRQVISVFRLSERRAI